MSLLYKLLSFLDFVPLGSKVKSDALVPVQETALSEHEPKTVEEWKAAPLHFVCIYAIDVNKQQSSFPVPWSAPKHGKPGEWMPMIARLSDPSASSYCRSGYSIAAQRHLPYMLRYPSWYLAETKGEIREYSFEDGAQQVRLLCKVSRWNTKTARMLEQDFRHHLYGDLPPKPFDIDDLTLGEGNTAFRAADDAATACVRAAYAQYEDIDRKMAARAASAERKWQADLIMKYLSGEKQ